MITKSKMFPLLVTISLFLSFSNNVTADEEKVKDNEKSSETSEVKEKEKLKLRFEFTTSFPVNNDESKNPLISPNLDFYKNVSPRTTLSLRFIPLFVYFQNDDNDVFGAGIGGSARFYFKKNCQTGLYTELHEIALFHQNNFESNTSNFNFYSAIGLGYKFDENWDLTLRFGHISNGNLKGDNGNVNLLGLGLGYSF